MKNSKYLILRSSILLRKFCIDLLNTYKIVCLDRMQILTRYGGKRFIRGGHCMEIPFVGILGGFLQLDLESCVSGLES